MYDIEEACKTQERYCEEKNLPRFAPLNGNCYYCSKNIYSDGGITVEEASTKLITNCPWCRRSYCE